MIAMKTFLTAEAQYSLKATQYDIKSFLFFT